MHSVRFGAVKLLQEYNPKYQENTFVIKADTYEDFIQRKYCGEAVIDTVLDKAEVTAMVGKPVEFSLNPLLKYHHPFAKDKNRDVMVMQLRWNDDGSAKFTDKSRKTACIIEGHYGWKAVLSTLQRYPLSEASKETITSIMMHGLKEMAEGAFKNTKARFDGAVNLLETANQTFQHWQQEQIEKLTKKA